MPLADVANAWMFSGEDRAIGTSSAAKGDCSGTFPYDQLYSMYESEAYDCGRYDPSTPTRPYLVTTDVFWELLAAAYEGVFIVKERQQAIPAFWELVDEADAYFRRVKPDSPWMKVFAVLESMKKPGDESEDVRFERLRIQKAGGREFSPFLGREVDYGELKPRGHYNSSEDMKAYFQAFKYLTMPPDEDAWRARPAAARRSGKPDSRNKSPRTLMDIRLRFLYRSFKRSPCLGRQNPATPLCKTPAGRNAAFSTLMGHGQRGAVFDGLPSRPARGRTNNRPFGGADDSIRSGCRLGAWKPVRHIAPCSRDRKIPSSRASSCGTAETPGRKRARYSERCEYI